MIIGSKHHHMLTTEGWEVIGPRYSTCSHTTMGSDGQLKRQRAEGGAPQNSGRLDCMKPDMEDSHTQSRDKETEGAAGSKAAMPGSPPNDSTRYARVRPTRWLTWEQRRRAMGWTEEKGNQLCLGGARKV
jgi:hypothetical protein